MTNYDDIIDLPYPFPSRFSRMSMIDRGAQFSPFAALTGYDAAIKETGRLTDEKIEMDEEALNILNMKRGTASWRVRQVERKGTSDPKGRGGNRRKRNFITIRMHGYEGKARGMILRWLNNGVNDRSIKFKERMGRKADKWNHNPNTGNRGSIAARNFFEPMASAALNVVSQHLAQIIEEEIERQFNENNNG